MGTLIHKAIELDFFGVAAPISILSIPIIFLIAYSVHVWITNKKIDKMAGKDVKVPSEPLVEALLIVMAIVGPLIISLLIYKYIHPTYNKSVKLTEIKDHVMIHDNKLTIKSLPEPYHYKNNKLNNLDPHDFKITKDEFYTDANPKLVDRDGNSYEITTEELNQLQK